MHWWTITSTILCSFQETDVLHFTQIYKYLSYISLTVKTYHFILRYHYNIHIEMLKWAFWHLELGSMSACGTGSYHWGAESDFYLQEGSLRSKMILRWFYIMYNLACCTVIYHGFLLSVTGKYIYLIGWFVVCRGKVLLLVLLLTKNRCKNVRLFLLLAISVQENR